MSIGRKLIYAIELGYCREPSLPAIPFGLLIESDDIHAISPAVRPNVFA